jgi:peroxiredoxin
MYNRYRHDRGIRQVPAQENLSAAGTAAAGETAQKSSEASLDTDNSGKMDSKKAYRFELEDITGKLHKLGDYEGKKVILHFWTTWSPYCREEVPDLQRIGDTIKDEKDTVLLLVDVAEDAETVREYADSSKLSLPVLLDKNGEVAQKYGIGSYPATLFVNRDGTVHDFIPESAEEETILAFIDKIK